MEGSIVTTKRKQNKDGHQALKAKATRKRIINAVVELINESGFSSASSTAIAKKAGITWGAVQHHFGNKEEILVAVMEMSRDVYFQSLTQSDIHDGTLEDRVSHFVDRVWEHYKSDLYFAFSEIVMATRGSDSKLPLRQIRVTNGLDEHLKRMVEIFEGYNVPQERLNEALRFTHRFLGGFALDRILEPGMPFEGIHIQRVKDQLLAIIHH